jgi:genome maintenance exonuclease 1
MDEGFPRIGQVYGCEVSLFNTDKYAGKADVIGIFEGQPAIMDFKQTNKPKRREWIQDYFYQLVAYALAHNAMYGTDIQKGAILMCSVDLNYQEFVIQGDEFKRVSEDWLKKVDQYWSENIFTDSNEDV